VTGKAFMSDNFVQTQPRVLIVDNEVRTVNLYKQFLDAWNYSVVTAEGTGQSLVEDAVKKARAYRCQIALVDIRLIDNFDEEDVSGIELIQKIKPAETIIVSAFGNLKLALDIVRNRGAVDFFEKSDDPDTLKDKLEQVANKNCAACRSIRVDPPDILRSAEKMLFELKVPREYHDQIYDAFARLFPNARTLDVERVNPSNSPSEFSTVPRPKSVILRVREDALQPVFVKLARRSKINKEVERFNAHIRGRLVGKYNPSLEKEVELWDIGGIKLSAVGTIAENFANFFSTQPIDKIKESLEHFFTQTWSDHYARAVDCSNISLFKMYCDVWERDWVKRASTYTIPLPLESIHPVSRTEIDRLNPLEWLKTIVQNEGTENDPSMVPATRTAVTHGDLHADNLLIDESQHGWVIDFERTGEGHALQDFVELESDVVTRFACTGEMFSSFYYFCLVVAGGDSIDQTLLKHPALPNPETQKLLDTIAFIRTLAVRCTTITDMRQYLLGLYFNTIFRATIISRDQHQQSELRAWMLASILCYRLAHWGEPWPPKEWETLQQ
jgi:ActR/RegA family two-component response regulator